MANFSLLNEDNVVINVIVVNDEDCGGGQPPESEKIGQDYIKSLGIEGRWLQTSVNMSGGDHLKGKMPWRKNFGAVGTIYVEEDDCFILPRPTSFPSWTFNQELGYWEPPVPRPEGPYEWNEDTLSWEIVEIEEPLPTE